MLFLVAHAPMRGALPFELLDELLVGAAFEQSVSVLFVGDGVYQLTGHDASERNIARGFRALPTYDVSSVYVERDALRARGIVASMLALPAKPLTRRGVQRLIGAHEVVVPD